MGKALLVHVSSLFSSLCLSSPSICLALSSSPPPTPSSPPSLRPSSLIVVPEPLCRRSPDHTHGRNYTALTAASLHAPPHTQALGRPHHSHPSQYLRKNEK